ncbi:MAG: hypothetical protein AAGC60_05320 [Acidobacteriota bacterium]
MSTGMRWPGLGLTLFLMVTVVAMENGGGQSLGLGLSALAVGGGIAWALRVAPARVRLCELYLWLSFMLSMYYFQILSEQLAGALGIDVMNAFRGIAAAHLLLVLLCLGVLGAWSTSSDRTFARLAAGLSIFGAAVFWIGARTFPGTSLEQVHGSPLGHAWTSICFLLSTVITGIGLVFLVSALRREGDRTFAPVGLFLFCFGAVFWVLHLVYRLTVLSHAAEVWAGSGHAPAWFGPWQALAGWLFAIYSVLAYLGLFAFGLAMKRTRFPASWVGWVCLLAGFLAAPLGGLPLFIHVPLWIAGLEILRAARTPLEAGPG